MRLLPVFGKEKNFRENVNNSAQIVTKVLQNQKWMFVKVECPRTKDAFRVLHRDLKKHIMRSFYINGRSTMKIVLVRHGETLWNAQGRLQGREDVPLSETGRLQAMAAGKALSQYPFPGAAR